MANKGFTTQLLAIVATMTVWFPILAPIVLAVIELISRHVFRLDYLMPAELFPAALVGGALLLWAALRARSRRGLIGWGLGIAAGLLFAGQALAVATGLASGETGPESGWLMVVYASLAIYTAALVVMGVGGLLLLVDVFGPARS